MWLQHVLLPPSSNLPSPHCVCVCVCVNASVCVFMWVKLAYMCSIEYVDVFLHLSVFLCVWLCVCTPYIASMCLWVLCELIVMLHQPLLHWDPFPTHTPYMTEMLPHKTHTSLSALNLLLCVLFIALSASFILTPPPDDHFSTSLTNPTSHSLSLSRPSLLNCSFGKESYI